MADRAAPIEAHLGFRVKALQQVLRTAMDAALRPTSVSTSQYAVLAAIRDLPGASGAALAARTFMTAQSLNELLVGLERRGLVARTPHPTHGRIIEARLTPDGEAAFQRAHAVVLGIEERMIEPLTAAERLALADMLEACRGALSEGGLASALSAAPSLARVIDRQADAGGSSLIRDEARTVEVRAAPATSRVP